MVRVVQEGGVEYDKEMLPGKSSPGNHGCFRWRTADPDRLPVKQVSVVILLHKTMPVHRLSRRSF
jgi:hypothetical protein